MEFIKVRNGYLVKGSNGLIVSESEKAQLEGGQLTIKGATCEACRTNKHKATATATSKKESKKMPVTPPRPTGRKNLRENNTEWFWW